MNNKDLKSLLKIMRLNGVLVYKTQELELQLSPLSLLVDEKPTSTTIVQDTTDNPYANFPTGMLSDQELMFYSAGGDPSDRLEDADEDK